MFRFTTPVPPRLSIELRAGTVDVTTAETGETTVELVALDDSTTTRDAIDAATVEQRGETIAVDLPARLGSFVGRGPSVAVRVAAPDASALRVKTGAADVVARGCYGTTAIDTGSGDIEVGVVLESLRVSAGSGNVRVERVDGDVTIKTGSGDAVVGTVHGGLRFTSGSGDLDVASASRALAVKSGSGNVTIGTCPPDVRITTASGDIRIDAIDEGDIHATAASGDVRAAVRAGTAAWLDVGTVSGRVRSSLDAGAAPDDGERTVRLHLSTVSGDIEVARA